ncbi:MAG TPA: hypothetical protein VJZ77_05925 [Blastocatellia bacterium]|nr:hypothetical protein [Blastocatellia bacterium]
MRELIERINRLEQGLMSTHSKIEEFKSAFFTANTASEQIGALILYHGFISGKLFGGYYNLPQDSLDGDYLLFLRDILLHDWLWHVTAERYGQTELRELAMRMQGTFLTFVFKKLAEAEAERGSALTVAERGELIESFTELLWDYIDAEFPIEPDESGDEVVEEYRGPGRPPKFDAIEATNRYLDLWPIRHRRKPYASNNIDGELVKQVMRDMKIAASHRTVCRGIQREIAYRTGEVTYPLEITIKVDEQEFSRIAKLARKKGHDLPKLSHKETVRAALGLRPRRYQKSE